LLAGILGGTVPRLFFAESVAFAQNPQDVLQKYKEVPTPATKVIRAERIELVNNHGKAVAVFEVSYSEALPAGSPKLTFTDRDEVFHVDRKVVLTTARLSMNSGQDEWSYLSPGAGLTFHDSTGGGGIGTVMMATRPASMGHGVSIYDPSGLMVLTGHNLNINDKNGFPVLMLPQ
ncbi:MAG TPA: hypothetical protein VN682_11300, partial [Terriglobales bacterium]|nr:hypothetical protein [Terriglobales bacterium]